MNSEEKIKALLEGLECQKTEIFIKEANVEDYRTLGILHKKATVDKINALKQEIAQLKQEKQVFRQLVQDSYKVLLNGIGVDDEALKEHKVLSEITVGDGVAHPVREGVVGIVKQNSGDWFLIAWSNEKEKWEEWINKSDVMSI